MRHRKLFIAVMIAGGVVVLCGPVASWLQCRELRLVQSADVLYVVAGAEAQDRRIAAAQGYLTNCTGKPSTVLLGNDGLVGGWSAAYGRNLLLAEWGREKLDGAGGVPIRIQPPIVKGTDEEMEVLARTLADHPEWRSIAIVTCPFHARRVMFRLRAYLKDDVKIGFAAVPAKWTDRAPWVSASELAKMARDAFGFSRVPFLSRQELVTGK